MKRLYAVHQAILNLPPATHEGSQPVIAVQRALELRAGVCLAAIDIEIEIGTAVLSGGLQPGILVLARSAERYERSTRKADSYSESRPTESSVI